MRKLVHPSMRTLILLLAFMAPLSSVAIEFPKVPPSSRILTAEEVQNYWFNTLKKQPTAKRPNGLYPLQQRMWDRNQEARKASLRSILAGKYHGEALLAALAHNIEVYRSTEKWDALAATQSELQNILEHRSKLALLEAQRRSAERVASAAEREADAAEREARAAEETAAKPNCPEKVEVVVVEKPAPAPCPPIIIPVTPSPPPAPRETLFPDFVRSR